MDKKQLVMMGVSAAMAAIAAARQDIGSWQKSGGEFDWTLAIQRWAIAAAIGASGAVTVSKAF